MPTLKKGDSTPEFEVQLTDDAEEHESGGDGEPLTLDPADEVRFYMEEPLDSVPQGQQASLVVNAAMDVDYQTATATYDFKKSDTARAGEHLAEVVVTFADGERRTFPDNGWYTISITEPVNRNTSVEQLDPPDITLGVVTADQVTTDSATIQSASLSEVAVGGGPMLSSLTGTNLSAVNGSLTASPGDVSSVDGADITPASVTTDVIDTDELYPKTVGGNIHHAREYPDIQSALSDSSKEDTIILEDKVYSGGGTIPTNRRLVGPSYSPGGASLKGQWDVEQLVSLEQVAIENDSGTTITITGNTVSWSNSFLRFESDIQVKSDKCLFYGVNNGEITFQSGTSGSIVDAANQVSVIDNGSNTIGDIG